MSNYNSGIIRNKFKCKGCNRLAPKIRSGKKYCIRCIYNGTMHKIESKLTIARGIRE